MKNLTIACFSLLCMGWTPSLVANANPSQGYNAAQAGLQLFTGRYHTGQLISVRADVGRLDQLGFNDSARSLVVDGTWEICEHASFTGRCAIISQDVLDLDEFGLLNELTAVRPVYDAQHVPHGFVFYRDNGGRIHEVSQYYAGHGYSSTQYSQYDRFGWHPIHLSVFASHGYYHPRLGYGAYGFAHPKYIRLGRSNYASHFNYNYRRNHNVRVANNRNHQAGRRIYANNVSVNPRTNQPRNQRYRDAPRTGDATLYVHGDGRGRSIGVNDSIRDLSVYGFNDRASSINISQGYWEVCEHKNFQGRCGVVDGSSGALNQFGFNDNISSIRRVNSNGNAAVANNSRANRNTGTRTRASGINNANTNATRARNRNARRVSNNAQRANVQATARNNTAQRQTARATNVTNRVRDRAVEQLRQSQTERNNAQANTQNTRQNGNANRQNRVDRRAARSVEDPRKGRRMEKVR